MKLEQLTFTRFLAAISIVIFHYGLDVFPFNLGLANILLKQANVVVSYFFILSGFVMIIAYGNNDKIEFGAFMKRRLARIYPAYFLAIIVFLIYFLVQFKPFDIKGLILNLTFLQSWIPGYALSFNAPGWSLSVEMFFYMLFPLLFNYFYKRYSVNKLLIPILLLFVVSQLLLHILRYSTFYKGFPSASNDLIFFFPLMHLSEFLVGNIAGLFFLKGIKKRNYDFYIVALISLIIILLASHTSINYHNGMLAFVFVPLILLISSNNGTSTKILTSKSLIFLGEISYGVYIFQKPVSIWICGILKYYNINNPALNFYLTVTVLIILSAISYKFIETPLRRIVNKKTLYFSQRKVSNM